MSQKKKEYPDRGEEIWNSEHLASSAESEASRSQPEELEDSELPSSSKSTPTLKSSSDTTSPTSPSIPISEPSTQKEESSTVSGADSPVPKPASPEQGKDLRENPAAWVENNSESSPQSGQNSPSLSSLQELSIEDYERFLADSEWQAIKAKLKSSRRRSLERDTEGNDCLLFPTLTSNSGRNSRPAGQNRLEQWFKHSSLILAGSQLNTLAMALIMGFPFTWFEEMCPLGQSRENISALLQILSAESAPDTSSEELSLQPKQQSLYDESSTSTKLGDRKMKEKYFQELKTEKPHSVNPPFNEPIKLSLSQLRRDGGTQPRASINHQTVLVLMLNMDYGVPMPISGGQ